MFPMYPMFPIMMGTANDLTRNNMKPVRLYRLLQSICNFEADEYVPTKDLAKVGRSKIFDFDYPLTDKVPRETFEVNILNHFMNRRIGFETPTAFKISLNAKLNEIMPMYNKMFDMLEGWELFNDGENITKTTIIEYGETADYDKRNTGTDTVDNTGTMTNVETGSITDDLRNSNMPQSELENVQDADYLTNYNYNTQTFNNHQNQNTQNTKNKRTADLQETNQQNKNIDETITETEHHTPSDKIKIYKEFLQNRTSIYTMIFDDLETCFYGLL